jgi:polyisoprenoid-binding protein YceI
MKAPKALVLAAAVAALTFSLAASAKLVGIGDNDVKFLALGPAGMKINGSAPTLKAEEKDDNLVVTVPVTDLKTGIGLRDKHLRGYLETSKYPTATLAVERSKLKIPENGKTVESSATGKLTLHGVSKDTKFKYQAKRTGSDIHVQGVVDVNILDHKIEKPCYLKVCVDPKIAVKVKFKLRDK